jgi:hypothetical protein
MVSSAAEIKNNKERIEVRENKQQQEENLPIISFFR